MEWFESWFDSPYYHLLYQNRNDTEAEAFMSRLLQFLEMPPQATVLDVACGKGRHARYLAAQNLKVTGIDLSKQSIDYAKRFEADNLSFAVHDMRKVYQAEGFDYVFNLFTSFGYFDRYEHNLWAIQAITKNLKTNGVFVIDFMNAHKVIENLVEEEDKVMDGVLFVIKREVEDGVIVKKINLIDEEEGRNLKFEERVHGLRLSDFEDFFQKTGLEILHTFGSYHLEPYDMENSNRLIIVATKK